MAYKSNDRCLSKVDSDEPIFVLRAQDATAIATIRFWQSLNPQLGFERTQELEEHINNFEHWQHHMHPERVKMPD